MTTTYPMRDAALPGNIGAGWAYGVGGYLHGPNAYHPWTAADWNMFHGNRKLPIWVGGLAGDDEGKACVTELQALGVPSHANIVLDLEDRTDETYVTAFGIVLQTANYRVWVYGSVSTLFYNPQLNGWWVADWTGVNHLYDHPAVRATQWTHDIPPGFDVSAVKEWEVPNLWL